MKTSSFADTRQSIQNTVDLARRWLTTLTSKEQTGVMIAHQVLSPPTHLQTVRSVQLATLATAERTHQRPQCSRITKVSAAGRATTAQRVPLSQRNALQARSIQTRAWRTSQIASFAHLAPSRTSGAPPAAKSVASSLTLAKDRPFASASVPTVHTLLKMLLAVARATSTTLMKMNSQRATLVT